MRFELRSWDLSPGALPAAAARLAAATAERAGAAVPPLTLRVEIGPLNRLVQLSVRPEGADASWSRWRPELGAGCRGAERDELEALPFAPAFAGGLDAPFFELRSYDAASPADLERLIAVWEMALPERLAHAPLVVVGRSADRAQARLVHLWAFASLDERTAIRRRVRAAGVWPPPLVAARRGLPGWTLARQECQILVAARAAGAAGGDAG